MKIYTKQNIKDYCRDNNLQVPKFSGKTKIVHCDTNCSATHISHLMEMAHFMLKPYVCSFYKKKKAA